MPTAGVSAPATNGRSTGAKRPSTAGQTSVERAPSPLLRRDGAPYHGPTKTATQLEFTLLGRLEVRTPDGALPLGGPLQRALLAFLLVHANRVVPRDQLVEELWNGSAPPTVNAILSTYASRLRRLLEPDPAVSVETEGAGYVLRVPLERIDAHRFEELAAEGRRALAAHDHEAAARVLREALALWGGPPFGDLAASFARAEIARLEDLHVATLENRIEVDLALGRHAEVVSELTALVLDHPYRERLRAQLMLALYRSRRQADALAAYRQARLMLVTELGIEPGPELQKLERQILRQDPSIAAPPGRPSPAASRRRRRAGFAVVAVLALLTLLAAVGGRPTGSPRPVVLVGDSLAVVDPESGNVVGEVAVGGRPGSVAVGGGSVWVGNRDDLTILRIDPASGRVVRTIGLGIAPKELVFAAGSVWVGDDYRGVVLRVDPTSGTAVARAPLGREMHPCCPISLATSHGAVWAARFGVVSRIDVATNRAVPLPRLGSDVLSIASGEGAVWAVTSAHLLRIDPRTGALAHRIGFGRVGRSTDQYNLAAFGGAVWIGNKEGRALWKVDSDEDRLVGIVPLGRIPRAVAVGAGAVWVSGADGTLLRIDPEQGRVVKALRLGVYPSFVWTPIAVEGGRVWIAVTAI